MATAGLKLDDGSGGFAANCFPVRTLIRQNDDHEAAGAWLVAHRAEQRRRFKAILCTKPKTFSQIREERRKSEKENSHYLTPADTERENVGSVLDGFFLLRHCCVDDPSHLCSINLSGKEISDVKEDDLEMFDNVAYVNAAENYLPFEAFNHFPIIRELEMPLNGLRGLHIHPGLFPHLEMLDLSFNNLSQDDVLSLGLLQHLKVLQLSGNSFRSLPEAMALPCKTNTGTYARYPKLEVLMLDDNKFSDVNIFACLAGLRSLRQLNLEKNDLYFVPQLLVVEGKVHARSEKFMSRKAGKSANRRPKSGRKTHESKIMDLIEQRMMNTPQLITDQGGPNDWTEENAEIELATHQTGAPVGESKTDEDLLNDDFGSADLTARISDLDLEREITQSQEDLGQISSVALHQDNLGPPPPPFSELRYLNLSNNQFSSEESLLAVAAWPMLVELMIYNNPLTDEHPGDPPLLKRFLGERLGINLVRKKPKPPGKKHVEVSTKKSRKVRTTVPKIPRPSVEQRLMLEAPDSFPERRASSSSGRYQSLPPLEPNDIRPNSATMATPEHVGPPASEGKSGKVTGDSEKVDTKAPEAWIEDIEDEAMDNPVFMTQVEDESQRKDEISERPSTHRLELALLLENERYKGYEELLDIDPDLDFIPPKDISGNIRALKYALGHELVYRDPAAQLTTIGKHVKPYRPAPTTRKPTKTRQERVDDMLSNLKTRQTVEEAELCAVLKDKKKLKKKFPEANTLLDEIQRRYNMVRVQSMGEASTSRTLVKETLSNVQDTTGSNRNNNNRKRETVT